MSQKIVDRFYKENGACCAGCDHWRHYNSVVGECIKSAPVGGKERWGLFDIDFASIHAEAGHVMTPRHHCCGDFKDT